MLQLSNAQYQGLPAASSGVKFVVRKFSKFSSCHLLIDYEYSILVNAQRQEPFNTIQHVDNIFRKKWVSKYWMPAIIHINNDYSAIVNTLPLQSFEIFMVFYGDTTSAFLPSAMAVQLQLLVNIHDGTTSAFLPSFMVVQLQLFFRLLWWYNFSFSSVFCGGTTSAFLRSFMAVQLQLFFRPLWRYNFSF